MSCDGHRSCCGLAVGCGAAPAWRRSRRRAAAVPGRAGTFHRSVDRDQSVSLSAAALAARMFARLPEPAALDGWRPSRRRPMARRRRPMWCGAGHADPAAAGRAPGAAGPRRRAGADLCGACARRGAAAGMRSSEVTDMARSAGRRSRRRRQSQQSGRADRRAGGAARMRRATLRRATASWWSMRHSWMSARSAQASPARLGAAISWCCARSANSSASPGCGSASRWRRRRSRRGCAPGSVHGRSPDPRSPSARPLWPTRPGSRRRAHASGARRRAGSTGSWPQASLDVVGGTSLFRLVRTPAAPKLFDHLGRAGILVRRFASSPPGCVSGCRATSRNGSACARRSRRESALDPGCVKTLKALCFI